MIKWVLIIHLAVFIPLLPAEEIKDLRAVHMGGNWGANVNGTKNHPPEYFNFLNSINVNWVGISVALHIDDSMDSTVERKYSNAGIPTFTDEVLINTISVLQNKGFNVYLTMAFESYEAESAEHPVSRWQLGDPKMADEDPNVSAEFWPWAIDHPDHADFVKSFWASYTREAVHFARIADSLGVTLFSLGTETDRLFRTRSGGYWPNDFKNELQAMVDSVREVYSGLLTYDMAYMVLTENGFYGPGSNHLWDDLNLDVVGISAYFKLVETMPTEVLSVSKLEQKWDDIFKNYLLPLKNDNPDLPIIFLEFGYVNSVEAPFCANYNEFNQIVEEDKNSNGIEDGEETQANIYGAFFNVNDSYDRIIEGAFLWGNAMASDYEWENVWLKMRHFGIRQKKAEDVVRSYYASLSAVEADCYELPERLRLYENYPNPFNPETIIRFNVAEPCRVILKVMDIRGREIATITDDYYQPGIYNAVFNAGDIASGLYLYRIQMKDFIGTGKMLLLR